MLGLAPINILVVVVLALAVIAGVLGFASRRDRPLLWLAAMLVATSACLLPPVHGFLTAHPATFWIYCAALFLLLFVGRYRQIQRNELARQQKQL
jgi:hypothetical protein